MYEKIGDALRAQGLGSISYVIKEIVSHGTNKDQKSIIFGLYPRGVDTDVGSPMGHASLVLTDSVEGEPTITKYYDIMKLQVW